MGGGHGHDGIKIPDWRIYKVEDVPELMQVQKALAQKGLRDPWLRNHVWRYHPGFGTQYSRMKVFFFRGFSYGAIAFLATIALETAFSMGSKGHDEHGHGH